MELCRLTLWSQLWAGSFTVCQICSTSLSFQTQRGENLPKSFVRPQTVKKNIVENYLQAGYLVGLSLWSKSWSLSLSSLHSSTKPSPMSFLSSLFLVLDAYYAIPLIKWMLYFNSQDLWVWVLKCGVDRATLTCLCSEGCFLPDTDLGTDCYTRYLKHSSTLISWSSLPWRFSLGTNFSPF